MLVLSETVLVLAIDFRAAMIAPTLDHDQLDVDEWCLGAVGRVCCRLRRKTRTVKEPR